MIFVNIFFALALLCFAISGCILFLRAWDESWLPAEWIMAITGAMFAIIAASIKFWSKFT